MIRRVLIFLNSFLAITAIGGGLGLLTGFGAPPVELLQTSVFSSYLIPGLTLLFIIGGVSSIAVIVLVRKHKWGKFISLLSACTILIFEIIEVSVIGSPEGVGRNLQIFYFALGFIIAILSMMLPWIPRKSESVDLL